MERKPVMSIKIEMNGPSVHMKGENAEVLMIPFKGRVESDIFTGIVEPCGVDTQIVNAACVRHLSARYMLTGKDGQGKEAHIYIENNGWFSEAAGPVPFRTVPVFLRILLCWPPTCTGTSSWRRGSTERTAFIFRFMRSATDRRRDLPEDLVGGWYHEQTF